MHREREARERERERERNSERSYLTTRTHTRTRSALYLRGGASRPKDAKRVTSGGYPRTAREGAAPPTGLRAPKEWEGEMSGSLASPREKAVMREGAPAASRMDGAGGAGGGEAPSFEPPTSLAPGAYGGRAGGGGGGGGGGGRDEAEDVRDSSALDDYQRGAKILLESCAALASGDSSLQYALEAAKVMAGAGLLPSTDAYSAMLRSSASVVASQATAAALSPAQQAPQRTASAVRALLGCAGLVGASPQLSIALNVVEQMQQAAREGLDSTGAMRLSMASDLDGLIRAWQLLAGPGGASASALDRLRRYIYIYGVCSICEGY